MFNIFKKLIKKEENEIQQEQNQDFTETENKEYRDLSQKPQVSDVVDYLYSEETTIKPDNTFDFMEESNSEASTTQQEAEISQNESQSEEYISLDDMEVEFSQEEIASAISQLEALDLEDETTQEPAEEEFFSIDNLEPEFAQPETTQEITEELLQITEEVPSIEPEELEFIEAETITELFEEQTSLPEVKEQNEEIIEQNPSKGLFGLSFTGLKEAVSKTSEFFNTNIFSLGIGKQEIDDDLLDEMEEKFIRADIGVNTTVYIIERLREKKNKISPNNLSDYLKGEFKEIIKAPGSNELNLMENQLNTILITGVNGAGKTTLIGKLAYRFKLQGKRVLVAAGDTFRAAAEEQLEIWADRAGATIVRQDGADPASVVFDSIKKAKAENYDILLIDTAGRLHNKFNLMEELKKIKKVIDKEAAESLVESILVLDATTGQNGLKQAEVFKEAVDLTAVGLTKLDGTAKGGVILGIAKELNLPVKLIGVGEKMEDLKDFNADNFIEALF